MSRRLALMTCTLMLAYLTGCSILPRLFGDHHAAQRALALQDLQIRVMRFADEYVGRMIAPLVAFQATNSSASARLAAQTWKVSQATSAYTIASGPNPRANALDFIVLATLSRMVLEDNWVGGEFGERARPLYDVHRHLEELSWELVAGVLDEGQKQQVRSLINDWRRRNPKVQAVSYIHFADFARSLEQRGQPLATGLLALLGLDPLSNIDPAVHEITQTRQLAERAIYYAQRSPSLLDMQIERLTYQLALMPEARELLADAGRTSRAVEQAGRVASEVPTVLARERREAIKQFMTALFEQQLQTGTLITELRRTLQAGTATSDSINAAIRSLDSLMARFQALKARREQALSQGEPFDIAEYSTAAREFAATTRELEGLLRTLDSGAPAVVTLANGVFSNAKSLTDYIFWRVAALLALSVALLFAAAVGYRIVIARWEPRAKL